MTNRYLKWTGVYDPRFNRWQVQFLQTQMQQLLAAFANRKDIWFSDQMIYHFSINPINNDQVEIDLYSDDPKLNQWYEQIAIGFALDCYQSQSTAWPSLQDQLIKLYDLQYLLYLLREIELQHQGFIDYRHCKITWNAKRNLLINLPQQQSFEIIVRAQFDTSSADEKVIFDQVARGIDQIATRLKHTLPISWNQDPFFNVDLFIKLLPPPPATNPKTKQSS